MSSVLAQFILYPAIIHSRVSKSTLDKTGFLNYSNLSLHANFEPVWSELDEEEKRAVLTIPHERTHFWDLTSFPVGMILWRLSKMNNEGALSALGFFNDSNTDQEIEIPLVEWLKKEGLSKIKNGLQSSEKRGWESGFSHLEDWVLEGYDLFEKFERNLLFSNDPINDENNYKLYNIVYAKLKSFFGFPCQSVWRRQKKLPEMVSKDHELALNLHELLEVRAYCTEAYSAGIFRSPVLMDWWLEGVPSEKIKNFFRWMRAKYIEPPAFMEITALALSPAIDPISYWGRKTKFLSFERDHPAIRMRRILYHLDKRPDLINQLAAFMRRLDDDYDPAKEEVQWAEFGESLFDFSTIPYSMVGGSRRKVMFGGEAQPVFVPFNQVVEYQARGSQLYTSIIDGLNGINPKNLFDSRAHNERIQDAFLINHAGMAQPYWNIYKLGEFNLPYCEIYRDEIHFKDSRISNLVKNETLQNNVILADLLSSFSCFSKDLVIRALLTNGQCWDFDEIIENSEIGKVLKDKDFIFRNLSAYFGEKIMKKIKFTSPPF